MAIFSFGMKIFKIDFQHVVDNMVPIARFPLQILVIWHCLSVFGENIFFYNSGFNS